MNNVRQHPSMHNLNGANNPPFLPQGGLANLSAMNQNGMAQPHPPGSMQHPGPQFLLQQQQQQMNHAGGGGPHPPPMGGLQSGNSPLGGPNMVQNAMAGAPGIQYTMAQQNPQIRQQMLFQQQHQRQQLNQGFPGGGMGGIPNQQHAHLSGMVGGASGMSNLAHMAGGQMNLQQMNAELQQGMAMRRVPSTNQSQSSQQVGGLAGQLQQGNPGANMNVMMGNNQIATLRQGGLLTGLTNTQQHQLQRLQNQQHGGSHSSIQGQQQQQHSLGGMGNPPNGQDASRELPANVAAAFSQRPSNFVNAHGAMNPGMSNMGASGINPNAPGAQRVPSAQAMTPGHSAGPLNQAGIPTHINHTPNPQQQNAHGAQQPPFVNPLQPTGQNNMQPPQIQQQHQHPGQLSQQTSMPGARGQGMPGVMGMPGPQHGLGQNLHGHPNSASPPRSGVISQTQTPALPMASGAGRPQSRQGEGNMNMMMVNSAAGRPQSRQGEGNMNMLMGFPGSQASLAMPGLGRPGQSGQQQSGQPGPSMQTPGGPSYPPYGVPGFTGGRITPQNPQNPMAGLGSSPGGPGSGPGPGMQAPQLTPGSGGRMGTVANATVPTPAGILAANQASGQRMNDYGHMPPLNQNMQGHLGTPHMVPPQRPPSQTRGHQPPIFTSPVVRPAGHQQGQELHSLASPQNGQRRGTPIQQPPMGTPLMHAAHPPGTQAVQQKRPPSRSTGTPHQQPQQAGPSRMTPRSQPATLPPTPNSSAPQSHEGTYNVPVRAGLGISAPNSTPHQTSPSTQQQPHPPTPQATQQPQNQTQAQTGRAQQQRPPTRTGAPLTGSTSAENGVHPSGQAMLGMPMPQGPRPPMYPAQAFTAPIATTRLQRFSDTLSQPKMPGSENYWINVVNEFFHPQAMVKITLWKDNMQNEAKPFEISMPILPRFFLVTSESGVSSMSISLENPLERPGFYTLPLYSTYLECANAAWTFRYTNGYIVTLRGPLTAHLVLYPASHPTAWKFESITFNSQTHEKALKIDAIKGPRSDPTTLTPGMQSDSSNSTMNSPSHDDERPTGEFVVVINRATIPAEPVNAFGIPQATMRCLELAESVGQMSELIEFSLKTGSGPLDALKGYAKQIRESHGYGSFQGQQNIGQSADGTMNGVAASPAVTLYQSSPIPSHTTTSNSGLLPPHNVMANQSLRQQGQITGDTSSPLMASTPASAQTPTAPPLSAGPSNSSHSTPMLVHTTLKRKAGDTSSPTTNTEQAPPAKRAQRKKSVRQGGG